MFFYFGGFMCVFFKTLETNNLRIIETQRKHDGCDSWDLDFTLLSPRKVDVDPQNNGCLVLLRGEIDWPRFMWVTVFFRHYRGRLKRVLP